MFFSYICCFQRLNLQSDVVWIGSCSTFIIISVGQAKSGRGDPHERAKGYPYGSSNFMGTLVGDEWYLHDGLGYVIMVYLTVVINFLLLKCDDKSEKF